MSVQPKDLLDRLRRIRAAALIAQDAERLARAAQNFEAEEPSWQQYDGAIAEILGLILSPKGVVELDAIAAQIGGAA